MASGGKRRVAAALADRPPDGPLISGDLVAASENPTASSERADLEPQSLRQPPASIELETPTRRGDVIAAVLCLSAGLAGFFFVVPAAVYVPSNVAGTVNSPAFLPNVLFVLLAGLGTVYLATSTTTYLRETTEGRVPASDWLLAGGTALICISYVSAIYLVGMTLASALCIAATTYYFGERRAWIIGTIAVVLPALLWYFFVEIAHILFPTPLFTLMEWLESSLFSDGKTELARFIMQIAGQGGAA